MTYVSPPIVEAVFSLQFPEPLREHDLRRAARTFSGLFPKQDEQFELDFRIKLPVVEQQSAKYTGSRLTNENGDKVILLTEREFAHITLAPYPGWDEFFRESWSNYVRYRKEIGIRKIGRAALRYVNRIDVPGRIDDVREYLSITHPFKFAPSPASFHYFCIVETNFGLANLNVTTVDSPLLGHSAILLDIDAYMLGEIPTKEGDLTEYFLKLRIAKNMLFESLVGEKARQMFLAARP